MLELLQPAFAVALLGAIESLLSATVADGMLGTKHDPNQELVGQGIANIGAALLGGFAATGAIARTATSIRHGGDSPRRRHRCTRRRSLLVLLVLAPLAVYVPLTTLAAVLFVVAFNMSQIGRVRARRAQCAALRRGGHARHAGARASSPTSRIAVEVGVILALLNFFRRMTSAVEVRALDEDELASRLPRARPSRFPRACSSTRSRARSSSAPSRSSRARFCIRTPTRPAS